MGEPIELDKRGALVEKRAVLSGHPLGICTVPTCLVWEALHDIRPRGGDPNILLQTVGLLPEDLEVPGGRITAELYADLWLAIADAIDDEFFGMNTRRMKRGSFGFISRAVANCSDTRTAVSQILHFFSIMFDDMSAEMREEDGLAIMHLHTPHEQLRAFTYFTFWLIVDGLICWLTGRRIPILAIDLSCSKPTQPHSTGYYRTIFTEELRFDQPENRLIFKEKFLDLPIKRSPAEVKDFLRAAPSNILVRYHNPSGFSAQVKRYLRSQAPELWPDLDGTAEQFGVSAATFRRRLEAEGKNFQSIKDTLRRDIAIKRLCNSRESVASIADFIGFADTSSFFRAFKKWTGLNPGEYRSRVKPSRKIDGGYEDNFLISGAGIPSIDIRYDQASVLRSSRG